VAAAGGLAPLGLPGLPGPHYRTDWDSAGFCPIAALDRRVGPTRSVARSTPSAADRPCGARTPRSNSSSHQHRTPLGRACRSSLTWGSAIRRFSWFVSAPWSDQAQLVCWSSWRLVPVRHTAARRASRCGG